MLAPLNPSVPPRRQTQFFTTGGRHPPGQFVPAQQGGPYRVFTGIVPGFMHASNRSAHLAGKSP